MESLRYVNRQRLARNIREKLITDLGSRHTRLITQETNLLESLILQQKTYPQILDTFRALIEHPSDRSPSFLRHQPIPEPTFEEGGTELESLLASRVKVPANKNYEYLRRRFQQETQRMTDDAEKLHRKHYSIPYSLEYSSKLDEIRAIEMQKLEETKQQQHDQALNEVKRRQVADTRRALDQQVQEKRTKALLLRQAAEQEKKHLDSRLFQQNYLDTLRLEREDQKRRNYVEALREQVRAKAQMRNEYTRLLQVERSLRGTGRADVTQTPEPRLLKPGRPLANSGNFMLYAK